jgi:hypothetical protein
MATFKVGQRVKVIRSQGFIPKAVGREATIIAIEPNRRCSAAHYIAIDGLPCDSLIVIGATGWAYPDQLAPLTDPRADAFIESLKKLSREPQPFVKVTA